MAIDPQLIRYSENLCIRMRITRNGRIIETAKLGIEKCG